MKTFTKDELISKLHEINKMGWVKNGREGNCGGIGNTLEDLLGSDTYDEKGNNHVLYKCSKCGHECDYNFDIAPVPIKWSEIRSGA